MNTEPFQRTGLRTPGRACDWAGCHALCPQKNRGSEGGQHHELLREETET